MLTNISRLYDTLKNKSGVMVSLSNHILIKQFLTYSLGAIILRLIMALSVFATVRFISPAEFGILALLNNLTIFIPIILGLGLRQVLAIEFFNRQPTWTLVWQLSLTYLIFAIPVGILLLLNLNWLNLVLFANQVSNKLILLVIITSLLNFFPELLFQLLRFKKKSALLASIQIGMGLIMSSCSLYLLVFKNLGIYSILIAQFLAQLITTIYFAYLLIINKKFLIWPKTQMIIGYLKTGLPFVPNIILAWLILACNRWLLNWQTDLAQVGIYSLSENISLMFQTIITQPLMHSFLPEAFNLFAQDPGNIISLDAKYQRFALYFVILLAGFMPIGFWLLKPILCLFLPAKYLKSLALIAPLLIAQVILAGTYISSASIQYLKKTHVLVIFMAISALIAIMINLLLIPTYQVYSCLIATNGAYLFYFGAIWFYKRYLFLKTI